ncbi:MAG: glycerophosphodiester phosphodiesterase [Oscillospiraceae bacterium]|nr:glycerophosphodiester phosphodiesterase [Oscillospiraceae bacterium]
MDCKVIAHRGANKSAPQNTLPAFKIAIEENADGFETDVHLTKDGQLIICHNYTLDATSDGRGEITSYTLGEIKKFDFGSYFSADFKNTSAPTVDEFLSLVGESSAEIINIELKSPKKKETGIVKKTLDCVKAHGLLDRCLISSFDAKLLKEVKELDPRCKTGLLYPNVRFESFIRSIDPFPTARFIKADAIHPMDGTVSYSLIKRAHKLGMKVNVWTVDSEKRAKALARMGADGIITNCPGKIKTALGL